MQEAHGNKAFALPHDPASLVNGAVSNSDLLRVMPTAGLGTHLCVWFRWAHNSGPSTATASNVAGYLYGFFPWPNRHPAQLAPNGYTNSIFSANAVALGTGVPEPALAPAVPVYGTWLALPDAAGNFLQTFDSSTANNVVKETGGSAGSSNTIAYSTRPIWIRTRGASHVLWVPSAGGGTYTADDAQWLGMMQSY